MTAVLAAIGRAVIFGILGLAAFASMLWAGTRHSGLATVAWLGVMFVTVSGCGVAWEWLGKRRGRGAR